MESYADRVRLGLPDNPKLIANLIDMSMYEFCAVMRQQNIASTVNKDSVHLGMDHELWKQWCKYLTRKHLTGPRC